MSTKEVLQRVAIDSHANIHSVEVITAMRNQPINDRNVVNAGIALLRKSCAVMMMVWLGTTIGCQRIPKVQQKGAPHAATPSMPKKVKELQSGDKLQISFPLGKYAQTVVFALSEECPHCATASVFYSRIAELAKAKGMGIVSLFPSNAKDPEKWMTNNHFIRSPILKMDLLKAGIFLAPMMMLVDRNSVAVDIWYGMPYGPLQTEVIAVIEGKEKPARFTINATDYEQMKLLTGSQVKLIDVRTRSDFARSHKKEAVNIPADEIGIRASYELASNHIVVIDCTMYRSSRCLNVARILRHRGFKSVHVLDTDAKDAVCYSCRAEK